MTAAPEHVAVVKAVYLSAILDGRKTIESRLMKTRREPFQRVFAGDIVYFRPPGGPYAARAIVARAEHHADLTPADIDSLQRQHNHRILGPDEYWDQRRTARYATLIWLDHVQPIDTGPALGPMFGRGWATIADSTQRRPA